MEVLNKYISALRNRGRVAATFANLSLRRQMSGRTLWIDRDFMKLPFYGDGDWQEVYYHLDGKEQWSNEVRLISPYLRQGDVAVDVGANLGFLTGIFSTLTGAAGQVQSFEPSPFVYAKLLEVIRVNKYTNVKPYNVACGKAEQLLTHFLAPRPPEVRHCAPMLAWKSWIASGRTPALSSWMTSSGRGCSGWNFLKIDTEGFEDEVLAGAVGLVQRFMPVVYIELCSATVFGVIGKSRAHPVRPWLHL